MKNNTIREFTLVGTIPNTQKSPLIQPIYQKISFKFDDFTKGNSVAITLKEGPFDQPEIDIYFDHKELEGILKFLAEQK